VITAGVVFHPGLEQSKVFRLAEEIPGEGGFTLAQKMVGRACGVTGIRPGG
jgi:aconitate hydratase 2/2-methylisocitrate dehydratase